MIDGTLLLFIEPSAATSPKPVIDELTMMMAAALRLGEEGSYGGERFMLGFGTRGVHQCRCGVMSTNHDYQLPDGQVTNSLAPHYMAYHRNEVPESELAKVAALTYGQVTPSAEELRPPRSNG